jgi:hypothetical protein
VEKIEPTNISTLDGAVQDNTEDINKEDQINEDYIFPDNMMNDNEDANEQSKVKTKFKQI